MLNLVFIKQKSKNAQEAHEAIRPTNIEKIQAGSTEDQKETLSINLAKNTIFSNG
jgi:DNA topoisomerase IA